MEFKEFRKAMEDMLYINTKHREHVDQILVDFINKIKEISGIVSIRNTNINHYNDSIEHVNSQLDSMKRQIEAFICDQGSFVNKNNNFDKELIILKEKIEFQEKMISNKIENIASEIQLVKNENKKSQQEITSQVISTQVESLIPKITKDVIIESNKLLQDNIQDIKTQINKSLENKTQEVKNQVVTEAFEVIYQKIKIQIDKFENKIQKNIELMLTEEEKKKIDIERDKLSQEQEKMQKEQQKISEFMQEAKKQEISNMSGNMQAIRNAIINADLNVNNNSTINHSNPSNIVKLDLDLIKDQIIKSVKERKGKISFNLKKSDDTKAQNINNQAQMNYYNVPCFFDGERIFGIYDPDNSTNIISVGDLDDNLLNVNLNKIHIWPKCHHIRKNVNFEITESDECEIHYLKDGAIKYKKIKLPICNSCLYGIYGNSRIINKTFAEFVDDFLNRRI